MQAIVTKYLGPTYTKGGRIKATCAEGSCTIGYPHELDQKEAHVAAARALCDKLPDEGGWAQPFLTASTVGGYVHVCVGATPTWVL